MLRRDTEGMFCVGCSLSSGRDSRQSTTNYKKVRVCVFAAVEAHDCTLFVHVLQLSYLGAGLGQLCPLSAVCLLDVVCLWCCCSQQYQGVCSAFSLFAVLC